MAKKRIKLTTLRRKADKLWSERVRELHGFKCPICNFTHGTLNKKGNKIYLNSHHIEGRKNWALRFDILNGIALCPGHHDLNVDSAEQSPLWFMNWLKRNRPLLINYLLEKRTHSVKTSVKWYMEIIEHLNSPTLLTDRQTEILNYPASFTL